MDQRLWNSSAKIGFSSASYACKKNCVEEYVKFTMVNGENSLFSAELM